MNTSPERIYLSDPKECSDISHKKHIARYAFSSMFVNGGTVLDCACGSGYGSKLLSKQADKVMGVDVSADAIEYAKSHYPIKNIEFKQQLLQTLSFNDNSFNTIVSIETLEHVCKEDMISFLEKAVRWLIPGGCFIGSSPMLRYIDNKPFITNPFHINELPKEDLLLIINNCFKNFILYFFHQEITSFTPLNEENTGFCIFVARKIR